SQTVFTQRSRLPIAECGSAAESLTRNIVITGQTNQLQREGLTTLLVIGLSLPSIGFVMAQWRPEQATSTYLTLSLMLAVGLAVILGAKRLVLALRAADARTSRLNRFEKSSKLEALTPIFDAGAMGRGWNRVVDLLGKQQLDQRVERRLANAVGNVTGER